MTPRPLDYESFVGLSLLNDRGLIRGAYKTTLGLSEFFNEDDMPEDWVQAISSDEFDANRLRFKINADRASARVWRDQKHNGGM